MMKVHKWVITMYIFGEWCLMTYKLMTHLLPVLIHTCRHVLIAIFSRDSHLPTKWIEADIFHRPVVGSLNLTEGVDHLPDGDDGLIRCLFCSQGAKNIYTREDLTAEFFSSPPEVERSFNLSKKRDILIFHCEFSSERAPNL